MLPVQRSRERRLRRFSLTELRHESMRHGAGLLRSRLARCDEAGEAVYLESSNPENVPLYEHFGFATTGALDLPDGAPHVATMRRSAKDTDTANAANPADPENRRAASPG
jgi:predicted GNAT family N-acyltransferase